MPGLLALLLATVALAPTVYTLINDSRKAAVVVDAILLVLVLAAHLQNTSILRSVDQLDIVRVILILSFHEFSSIYSDLRRLEADYQLPASDMVDVSSLSKVPKIYIIRSFWAAGILIASTVISEGYYLLALQSGSSLYNIFGVAGGLTVLIIFLFYLFQQTSNRSEDGT